jgi:CxxC-x17-CxxC domain-containing protein
MDEQNNDRKMYQGSWTCSSCNKEITELPFEPRGTDNLLCRECHAEKRASQGPRRQTHQGSWDCSSCGGPITELPFEPRDTSNLMCRDCFKKSKGFE